MISKFLLPLVGMLFLLCGLQALVLTQNTPIFRGFQDIMVIQERFASSPEEEASSELVVSLGKFQTAVQKAAEASVLTRLPGFPPLWETYQARLEEYLGNFLHYQSLLEQSRSLTDQMSDISNAILNRLPLTGVGSGLGLQIRRTSLEAVRLLSKGTVDPESRSEALRLAKEGQDSVKKASAVPGLSPEEELQLFRLRTQADAMVETAEKSLLLLASLDRARGMMILSARAVLEVQAEAAENWRLQLLVFQTIGILGLAVVAVLGMTGHKVGRKKGP